MLRGWFMPLLIAAALLGWLAGTYAADVQWLSTAMTIARALFLDGLKLVIGPLIFLSLMSGVINLGAAANMRRLGTVTLLYYLGTTAIAVLIGLLIVTLWHPWTESPPLADAGGYTVDHDARLIDADTAGLSALAIGLVKRSLVNPIEALATLNILGIVTNALLFGLAALVLLPRDAPLHRLVHDATQVVYKVAAWIVALAPVGILGIVYHLAADLNLNVMGQLLTFSGVVLAGTAVHGLLILPLLAWWLTGRNPWALLRAVAHPMFVALTTSSSAATLPVSMRTAEERLGVSRSTASFVLPLGATINMDGTALFEGIAAVFLAYLFGIELGTIGLITVFVVAMVSSIGAPGVPSGSMAGMQMVLLAAGIPLEAIGLLLLIERPLDTFRTAVNVEGDLIACTVAQSSIDLSLGAHTQNG